MIPRIVRYPRNTVGMDIVVGDIHGCFSKLQATLDDAGFNPETDRLFSVGDLVDRGPESDQVLEWLARPWFHPVRGNHDDYVVRYLTCDRDNWLHNGGAWFQGLPWDQQAEMATQMNELPIAIEVETAHGVIGIVHAECPYPDWGQLSEALSTPEGAKRVQGACMWERSRVTNSDVSEISGITAVIVGHTPVKEPAALGNTVYIDTMGWRDNGYFTFLDLSSVGAT